MCLHSCVLNVSTNLIVIWKHYVCLQVQSPITGVSSTLGQEINVIDYFLCAYRYNPRRRAGDKPPVSVSYNVSQCVLMYVVYLKFADGMVFLSS